MRIQELLRHGESRLNGGGVRNARRNAEWMLCHALGCSILDLYVDTGRTFNVQELASFTHMIDRRSRREPLQHILGTTDFMSLRFEVRPGVFVPRPDTEVLVERAERRLRALPIDRRVVVADLCCGSGVVGVSLAARIPNIEIAAVDGSADAINLTRGNAERLGVGARVSTHEADAVSWLRAAPSRFSGLVCNPPYIETGLLRSLPLEVRDHEPIAALDGGPDGLSFYRAVVPELGGRIEAGGFVAFEIGDGQADAVGELLRNAGFTGLEIVQDYAGKDRVVLAGGSE